MDQPTVVVKVTWSPGMKRWVVEGQWASPKGRKMMVRRVPVTQAMDKHQFEALTLAVADVIRWAQPLW